MASNLPAVAASAPGVDMADLKRKSVRGGAVTVASQGVSIGIQLTSTVVLARLLRPEDYGILAMVMAVTSFVGLFRDMGLSSAAIQRKELSNAQQNNLFWLNVALGTILMVLVATMAPLVVWFYGKPELKWVTVALSVGFLIGALGSQHNVTLVRNLQFGRQAAVSIATALTSLIVSISLAYAGYSYWALVWGSLAGSLLGLLILFILSPLRVGWYKKRVGTKSFLGFGANVTASSIILYFYRNLDNVLIGKFWGAQQLGIYSRAYSLLMLPINGIKGPIESVAFPSLSRLQEQPDEFRIFYRNMTRLLAMISMPFSAILFVSSEPLIELALGPGWSSVSSIFSVLAVVALVQPTVSLWGIMLLSRGLSSRLLRLSALNALVSGLGFACGLPWGGLGVAVGYLIAYYALTPFVLWVAFKDTPLSVRDFSNDIKRPFGLSLLSAGISLLLISAIHTQASWTGLLLAITSFSVAFLIVFFLLPGSKHDISLIKSCILRFKPATP